jgi:hypothetical protein
MFADYETIILIYQSRSAQRLSRKEEHYQKPEYLQNYTYHRQLYTGKELTTLSTTWGFKFYVSTYYC